MCVVVVVWAAGGVLSAFARLVEVICVCVVLECIDGFFCCHCCPLHAVSYWKDKSPLRELGDFLTDLHHVLRREFFSVPRGVGIFHHMKRVTHLKLFGSLNITAKHEVVAVFTFG